MRSNLANFPPIFRNTLVSKNHIGDLMKTDAKENGITTSESVDIKFHITKGNTDLSSALDISATAACCYKKTPFC